jgi:hypothetical protein
MLPDLPMPKVLADLLNVLLTPLGAALVCSPGGGGEPLELFPLVLFLLGIMLFLLGVPALLQKSGPVCAGEDCGFQGQKIPWPGIDSFRVLSVLSAP